MIKVLGVCDGPVFFNKTFMIDGTVHRVLSFIPKRMALMAGKGLIENIIFAF
jgi:hypothetical protein